MNFLKLRDDTYVNLDLTTRIEVDGLNLHFIQVENGACTRTSHTYNSPDELANALHIIEQLIMSPRYTAIERLTNRPRFLPD